MRWYGIPLVVVALAGMWWVQAADKPTDRFRFISPYLDEKSVGVIHLDLTKFDSLEFAKLLAGKMFGPMGEAAVTQSPFGGFQRAFINAGGTEIWMVFRPLGNGDPGFYLVPLSPNVKAEPLVNLLNSIYVFPQNVQHTVINGTLVYGSAAQLKDVKKGRVGPVPPGWSDGFAAVAQADASIVAVPSTEFRQMFDKTTPRLPPELGGGVGTIFSKGLRWFTISLTPPPKTSLQLTIQAEDATAAQTLAKVAEQSLTTLGELSSLNDNRSFKVTNADSYAAFVKLLTPNLSGTQLTLNVPDLASGANLATSIFHASAGFATERGRSQINLEKIAGAMHKYLEEKRRWPSNIVDKNGKPLLSWRVQLLPYLEQEDLYKQFKLDQPWDSVHNKKLLSTTVKVYRSPKQVNGNELTTYLAPVLKNSLCPLKQPENGIRYQEIPDGTLFTIALVETSDELAVPWTKPGDYVPPLKDPVKPLLGHYGTGFNVAFATGSVHFMPATIEAKSLLAFFTRDGGEQINSIP